MELLQSCCKPSIHTSFGINILNMRGLSYLGLTMSIPLLLMPWLLVLPGYQQRWYWLFRVCRSLSYLRKDFIYPVFQITASPSARSRQLWRRTGNFFKAFLQFYVYDLRFKAAGLTTFFIEFWTLIYLCISIWRNDIKCKYMFMFPLQKLARKGLKSNILEPVYMPGKFPKYTNGLFLMAQYLQMFISPLMKDHLTVKTTWRGGLIGEVPLYCKIFSCACIRDFHEYLDVEYLHVCEHSPIARCSKCNACYDVFRWYIDIYIHTVYSWWS